MLQDYKSNKNEPNN